MGTSSSFLAGAAGASCFCTEAGAGVKKGGVDCGAFPKKGFAGFGDAGPLAWVGVAIG